MEGSPVLAAKTEIEGLVDRAAVAALRDASFAAGLSIALVDASGRIATGQHGFADLAAERPVTADTQFEIGSISKSFTSALLLQARDDGLVDLDQPVRRWLPWFEAGPWSEEITLRHLMSHTAGIVQGTEFSGDATFEVWSLRDTEVCVAPGSWFHYSNVGYKALGLVLERVHDRPYRDVLSERLLRPLGMTSSAPAITHQTRRRLAVGYEPFYDDRPPRREHGLVPATWVETATADGSIASTAQDMARWLYFLAHRGLSPSGDRVLSEQSVQEMLRPAAASDEELHGSSYGLGIWTVEIDGHRFAGHLGGMVGYFAAIALDLEERTGAVVLANGQGPWREVAFFALAARRAERTGGRTPTFSAPDPEPPAPPSAERPPSEWEPLVGHYRCHNPWLSNLRVYFRDGRLWLWFGAADVPTPEEPLTLLADGAFRVGSDERSPERLRFDTVVDGAALRATFSGCALYRTFTP